ncbi:MAG: ABC transporter substrate-binding protein, partial [Acidimicrobiales bacterium]
MKKDDIQAGDAAARLSRRGFIHGAASLGGLAALSPVLAACSSSSGKSGGSTSEGGQTLKIGVTAALSGPLAPGLLEYTGYMKRVFDEANTSGGVNGHTFDMILMDDGGDGNAALVNTRKLVESDNVLAMSVGGTAETSGVLPYLVQKQVPLLFPAAYVDTITSPVKPTVFALWEPYDQQIAACVKWGMATKGAGTAVLVFATTSYSASSQTAAETAVAATGGHVLKVINTVCGKPEW